MRRSRWHFIATVEAPPFLHSIYTYIRYAFKLKAFAKAALSIYTDRTMLHVVTAAVAPDRPLEEEKLASLCGSMCR